MSSCMFIASDKRLEEFAPSQDYPLHINIDEGTINDGGADDNYFLNTFRNGKDYTDKEYAVSLEWNYTDGRAKQLIEYIKTALQETKSVEFWHVWLMDYCEFEERPFTHRKTISIYELETEHIREMDCAVIWNTPDKMYPGRPSFYCLTITK